MPIQEPFATTRLNLTRLGRLAGHVMAMAIRFGVRAGLHLIGSSRRRSAPAPRRVVHRVPLSRLATTPALPFGAAQVLRGEYRLVPLSSISPAARPARLLFDGIERLATSIAGGADHEGLGLMSPVVVRILDGDRYELIDGERRIRACRLIASWSGGEDCLIPAIAYNVSARVAQLMRVATLDVPEPRAIELSRIYHSLRDAVVEEGAQAPTARALALVGHHGKTQIADYLRIADALTDDVLIAAGLASGTGDAAPESLVDLTKRQLLDVAKADTLPARAAALRTYHERNQGSRSRVALRAEAASSQDENEEPTTRHNVKGRTLSLIKRSRTMPPCDARALIENEVAPAMIALVEQAHGGCDAEGYYSEFTNGHACLVLPRDVEGLTLEQLDRLDHTLEMLASRTRRAREERLRVGTMLPPRGDRKTS